MKDAVFSRGSSLVQHYDELVDYISLKVGSRQIALGAVQETYLRVLQRPEQFLNLMHPSAFLKKVSINIALDHLRKDKNYGKHFEALEHDEIDALAAFSELSEQELSVARDQYAQLILKQIAALPPACQDVFLLIQFYGMTQVEAAQQLGISRTMVIRHFTKALQSFIPVFIDEQHGS
ncbi:RNA polymerase sigma factor [Acinetobacter sp.]|uniref:RNA polymerase sigma factor n=1 Tax=Acinetobacter sp. TaxID=472 RepID=UPI0035B4A966